MLAPAVVAVAALLPAQPPKSFELKDGDRIVWVGGTLVEREQRYGYWETALYAAHPDKTITLRNLGWSGDTVWGESRGRFDFADADKCFRQLVDQTLALKPTVIFVSYGQNESFEGEAGLAKFEQGLNKLLDALKPANARIVLFTPFPARKSDHLPDPAPRNRELAKYCQVIRRVATRRETNLADLFDRADVFLTTFELASGLAVSENGIHLDEKGYRAVTPAFVNSLTGDTPNWDWKRLESLRQAVVEKNQLFFHRWRPQNETYLFGFRKHEQGKNAKEVAEFDPLVSKAEEEIAKIRKTLLK